MAGFRFISIQGMETASSCPPGRLFRILAAGKQRIRPPLTQRAHPREAMVGGRTVFSPVQVKRNKKLSVARVFTKLRPLGKIVMDWRPAVNGKKLTGRYQAKPAIQRVDIRKDRRLVFRSFSCSFRRRLDR